MNDNSSGVLCPYYRREGNTYISCEGFAPGAQTQVGFMDPHRRQQWQEVYCMRQYHLCPIAYLLAKKYE